MEQTMWRDCEVVMSPIHRRGIESSQVGGQRVWQAIYVPESKRERRGCLGLLPEEGDFVSRTEKLIELNGGDLGNSGSRNVGNVVIDDGIGIRPERRWKQGLNLGRHGIELIHR